MIAFAVLLQALGLPATTAVAVHADYGVGRGYFFDLGIEGCRVAVDNQVDGLLSHALVHLEVAAADTVARVDAIVLYRKALTV